MGTNIYPPPGSIKSIQRGATAGNVTIAAVNMSKSVLRHNGAASETNNGSNASLRLTSETQITYNRGALSSFPTVSWELVEYY